MLKTGILNPHINSLLARVRHTNTLVIADRGFPYFPTVETIDISLVDDIPRVLDVLAALRENFVIGRVWMAEEFWTTNEQATIDRLERTFAGTVLEKESHKRFKERVPGAVGLIRTADTVPYANMILESA